MMNANSNVVIGIPIRANPSLLGQTLDSLSATASSARLVLLPDCSNPEVEAAISKITDLLQLPGHTAHGNPSCFNRLLRSGPADVYILLENGTIPAMGWLDRLLSTFARLPRCGLTGPSTNRSWNEQGVLPSEMYSNADIAVISRSVERRFGAARRSLRPLHSLGDFCYAVRREVIDAIGEADEGYGSGPCWEMDYNIRAHRAGFLGVWTCGAYVHRAAEIEAAYDACNEASLLKRNKERYQEKFCGLRLRGLKSDYREHCRGDACQNFAPAALIQLRAIAKCSESSSLAPPDTKVRNESEETPEIQPAHHLVSCIMPTYNRRSFVPDALACFQNQTYPDLELIVADDGTESVADLMPADPRIRYFRLEKKLNTGAKRNFACEQARGQWIAHWDDDDWHAPDRIQKQMNAMLASSFQICGTTRLHYQNKDRQQAYQYTYKGPGRAFMGALMYTREAWERYRFESIQVGEDVRFIGRIPVVDRLDLNDPFLTIGTIHASNTSPKITSGPYWIPEPIENVQAIIDEAAISAERVSKLPLISCIMPTHNRRSFIGLALDCFHAQTYAGKELVVIDDGTDPVGDLLEGIPGVRYVRSTRRLTIGAKRNLACELAQGELIAHWDDDDWYGPERLAHQAAPLNDGRCDLTGLVNTHTLEMPSARFWSISNELHHRMFVGDIHGGTLMYRKALLREGIRYPEANLAEDAALVRQLTQRKKRVMRMADPGLFVYLRHGQNTWKFDPGRFVDPKGWRAAEPPEGFPPSILECYREACRLASQTAQ
jgi:glycosyltransferase involved in cell wall biosynthesis